MERLSSRVVYRNPWMLVREDEILKTGVIASYLGGKAVYQRP